MITSDSCKDGASKSNNDEVSFEMNDMLHKISTVDNDNDNNISICANCGKEGSDVNNICNKCKKATYCNAACKKKHRHKHKKECEEHVRLVTEKHDEEQRLIAEQTAKLYDQKLFKQPPPKGDCPICLIRIPTLWTGSSYYACCGKVICNGCAIAPVFDNHGNVVAEKTCPFCRMPPPNTRKQSLAMELKRVEAGDSHAMYNLGCDYRDGANGSPQNHKKALEILHRAGEHGSSMAFCKIGYAYDHGGLGLKVDKEKAKHYYELGAMGGDSHSRNNLGGFEYRAGNKNRALKHCMMAVEGGSSESLIMIKQLCSEGYATKDDYMKALQSYQEYLGEIKSVQRDKAAAYKEEYRYY